ncbi:MAG: protogloblin ApPgb, partial [Phycisphaerales bacterium]|nr:protogloblin ApPgb [Phycisphaerales bacterium]
MSEAEFALLKKSFLFTDEDVRFLRMSRGVLEPNVDELLDVWYGFVGANDHLVYYFSHPTTRQPNSEYLMRVRARFRDWVLTTAAANFDQAWLNQQLELGLRHHRLKKNRTDGVEAVAHIPMRYVIALHYPITTTLRPFLARGGHMEQEVQGMYEAWRKAV